MSRSQADREDPADGGMGDYDLSLEPIARADDFGDPADLRENDLREIDPDPVDEEPDSVED